MTALILALRVIGIAALIFFAIVGATQLGNWIGQALP
jgi:hypothetical protein